MQSDYADYYQGFITPVSLSVTRNELRSLLLHSLPETQQSSDKRFGSIHCGDACWEFQVLQTFLPRVM